VTLPEPYSSQVRDCAWPEKGVNYGAVATAMKRALAILVGTVMVCAVAYLSWLNPTAVEFRFTPTRSVQAPLAALHCLAFIVATLMILPWS